MIDSSRNSTSTILAFCTPFYEDVALNELGALLGARPGPRLAPGLFVLDTPIDGGELQRRMDSDPPIFTRQALIDAVAIVRNGDAAHDAERVRMALGMSPIREIQVCDMAGRCPPDAAALLGHLAATIAADDDGVLPAGVVMTRGELWVGRVLAGAGLKEAPLWPGGRPAFAYDPSLVSRSALKLIEALDLFGVHVRRHDRALDLGASPGGWSQVLAARGMLVTAVDPGALDPRVLALRDVVTHRLTAQQFLAGTIARYRLIVDDMRLDAGESARILARAADALRAGGECIVTLKLPERRPSAALRQALAIVRGRFRTVRARCLYHNRHEVTVYARPD